MLQAYGRCALIVSVGAFSAAAIPATPCRGAVIQPGLHARAEALEWIAPWIGIGDQDIDPGQVAGPGRLASAAASMTPDSNTTALAFAHYGFLVNEASVIGSYAVPSGREVYAQGITNTSFRDDQVVVEAPGIATGTAGSLTAEYIIDRFIDFDLTSVAGFSNSAVVVGGFSIDIIIGSSIVNYSGTWSYDAVTGILTQPSVPNGVVQTTVPFQYGVPFTIAAAVEMKLNVYSKGAVVASSDSAFSLGPAFIWQGITDGLPDDATVSSPDVPDWRNPYGLPAPGVGAAALLTIAGIGARRSRRVMLAD